MTAEVRAGPGKGQARTVNRLTVAAFRPAVKRPRRHAAKSPQTQQWDAMDGRLSRFLDRVLALIEQHRAARGGHR
jgi:hypothetical protein